MQHAWIVLSLVNTLDLDILNVSHALQEHIVVLVQLHPRVVALFVLLVNLLTRVHKEVMLQYAISALKANTPVMALYLHQGA